MQQCTAAVGRENIYFTTQNYSGQFHMIMYYMQKTSKLCFLPGLEYKCPSCTQA